MKGGWQNKWVISQKRMVGVGIEETHTPGQTLRRLDRGLLQGRVLSNIANIRYQQAWRVSQGQNTYEMVTHSLAMCAPHCSPAISPTLRV